MAVRAFLMQSSFESRVGRPCIDDLCIWTECNIAFVYVLHLLELVSRPKLHVFG